MSQPAPDIDLEKAKATSNAKTDRKPECRPTISAIDIHFDGRTQRTERHPRSLRKDETKHIASLPPLAPKCARIYLKEEDCRARDAFAAQGIFSLEWGKRYSQALLQSFQNLLDLSPELIESTIARVLENSGVDRWWSVHEVDRFDIWDLRNLFDDQQQASRGFLVQLNVEASQLHERAMLASSDDTGSTKKRLNAGRFSGDIVFWEKYALLKICPSQVKDAFEVHCFFPALSYALLPEKPSDEYVIPTLRRFEQFLCSGNTSVPSDIDDPSMIKTYPSMIKTYPSMIKTYIVLDFMRCVTQSWLNFLKCVSHVSSPGTLTQSQHDNDIHVTTALQNAVDDLKACVSYLLDRTAILNETASAGQPVSKVPSESSSRKHLLVAQDLRAQVEYLSRRSTFLRERFQRLFEADNAATSNEQAQSAGRLTVVASIFLPLTLAASLLAMNVPAASIGRLWYDFAGLVICIALICFASYKAYGKVQAHAQSDSSMLGASHSLGSKITTKSDRLSDIIWVVLLWGFPAVVAASFLGGMFNSFDVARDAVIYGLPIMAGLIVVYSVARVSRLLPPIQDVRRIYKFLVADKGDAQDPGDATTIPGLSTKPYDKHIKAFLMATAEAIQNMKAHRRADPGKPMTGLMQQLLWEFRKLIEVDVLLDNPENKGNK